jgi:hypothetical protein
MAQFPSTQWSLIRRSSATPSGRQAFGELVSVYRAAIIAFFRSHLPADVAEDAVQSFLAASYEHSWWSRADPSMGTFRNFLLVLLRRHLGHLRQSRPSASFDVIDNDLIDDSAPGADSQFDLRFALVLTGRAVDAQRAQYARRGRSILFEKLLPLLSSPPEHGELKRFADVLKMPANSLTIELQRLRRRLRDEVRTLLEDLCADEASFAAEWVSVQRILSG